MPISMAEAERSNEPISQVAGTRTLQQNLRQSPSKTGTRFRILIVDDEPGITSALVLGLERRGFIVKAYNNPLAALSEFKPGMYDASILDIRMPEINGFELCRRLRKIDSTLRICFLTAFDVYQKEFETMFPEVKADALFRKPVTLNELVTKLQHLLEGGERPGLSASEIRVS